MRRCKKGSGIHQEEKKEGVLFCVRRGWGSEKKGQRRKKANEGRVRKGASGPSCLLAGRQEPWGGKLTFRDWRKGGREVLRSPEDRPQLFLGGGYGKNL